MRPIKVRRANGKFRVEMYTSYADPTANAATAEPSGFTSAAPNTPAMSLKANLNVDNMAPLPPHMGQPPTSSPAMTAQQTPQASQVGSPSGGQSWHMDAMKDVHLSGSEPRIYPGMISRRQRTNSLRQSSTHESDERTAAKRVLSAAEAVDEAGEGEGEGSQEAKE